MSISTRSAAPCQPVQRRRRREASSGSAAGPCDQDRARQDVARRVRAAGSPQGDVDQAGAAALARVLRKASLAGSAQASVTVIVEPTVAPAEPQRSGRGLDHRRRPLRAARREPRGCRRIRPARSGWCHSDVGVTRMTCPPWRSSSSRAQLGLLLRAGPSPACSDVFPMSSLQRPRTEHDPDGERQEDRDDGDEVVAEVDHANSSSDPGPRGHPTGRRAPGAGRVPAVGGPQRGAEGEQPDRRA